MNGVTFTYAQLQMLRPIESFYDSVCQEVGANKKHPFRCHSISIQRRRMRAEAVKRWKAAQAKYG